MIDMSRWRNRSANVVDELHLDPNNVRLELPADVPEADIIQDLFQNEKAMSLVEGIARVGYLTHEVPIVVERSGRLVVVEGNRRVAALKAIQNPYLVPAFQARINRFVAQLPGRASLKNVTVLEAPDQGEADQLVAALHTSNLRVPWSPARQAAFFEAQIAAGKSIDDLRELYPFVDVKDFIVRAAVLQLFKSVSYLDGRLGDALNRRRGIVSILARLYENDEFLKLARIKLDVPGGKATATGSKKRFAALAEKIVYDIVEKEVDTRRLNRVGSDTYEAYMEELRAIVAPYDGAHASSSESTEEATDGAQRQSGSVPRPRSAPESRVSVGTTHRVGNVRDSNGPGTTSPSNTPQSRRRKLPSAFLDVTGISVPASFPRQIDALFDELGRLSVESFPNASMDLLRTFIEKSIKAYADAIAFDISTTQKNPNSPVQLSQCLLWIQDEAAKDKRALAQVAKKVRDNLGVSYVSTSDHLNAINHNHLVVASPNDVRTAWTTVEPLIRWILRP